MGEPKLSLAPDTGAVLTFPLRAASPGAFDLVLGFLPADDTGGGVSLVGNGHIELNNLFGAGRRLSLRLDRLPGSVSSADFSVSDPFLFGLPVGVEAAFSGLQQDSAYTKHRLGGEAEVRLLRYMSAFASLNRESTRPGAAGWSEVARSDAWFVGAGVRLRRIDDPLTPTRGQEAELVVESGRRVLDDSALPVQDATSWVDQERVRFSGRAYRAAGVRHILVLGADAAAVLSGVVDQSDLLRFGGANSLRGYDEDRFLARTAVRGLLEYRYLLDARSYAFAFFDAGYVEMPTPGDRIDSDVHRGFYPGYGIGMRFDTRLGMVSASYALSRESGLASGRVHVGVGLRM